MENEAQLRKEVIRLAHAVPELRQHLVPLLREARAPVKENTTKLLEGHLFTHPVTHNKVKFTSLPADEQKRIRGKAEKHVQDSHDHQELAKDKRKKIEGDIDRGEDEDEAVDKHMRDNRKFQKSQDKEERSYGKLVDEHGAQRKKAEHERCEDGTHWNDNAKKCISTEDVKANHKKRDEHRSKARYHWNKADDIGPHRDHAAYKAHAQASRAHQDAAASYDHGFQGTYHSEQRAHWHTPESRKHMSDAAEEATKKTNTTWKTGHQRCQDGTHWSEHDRKCLDSAHHDTMHDYHKRQQEHHRREYIFTKNPAHTRASEAHGEAADAFDRSSMGKSHRHNTKTRNDASDAAKALSSKT